MFTRIALVCVLFILPLGCAKKAKLTGSGDNNPNSSPPPAGDKGKSSNKNKNEGDKANWIGDSRYRREQPGTPPEPSADAGGLPGKPGWGLPPVDLTQPPPQPGQAAIPAGGGPALPGTAPGGFPPTGPAVKPSQGAPPAPPAMPSPGASVAPSGGKAVTEADMKDVWIFIENRSGATGAMPAAQTVLEALLAAKSSAAELVRDGYIVLSNARGREGIWAYERKALTNGGLVATQNGVETLTAPQLAARLGGR